MAYGASEKTQREGRGMGWWGDRGIVGGGMITVIKRPEMCTPLEYVPQVCFCGIRTRGFSPTWEAHSSPMNLSSQPKTCRKINEREA